MSVGRKVAVERFTSRDVGVRISSFAEGRWAESAELGNRDIVVGMAGQRIGRTNDNLDELAGSTPVETVVSRAGGWVVPTINRCGDEWSG
jgi:hypothetical protein